MHGWKIINKSCLNGKQAEPREGLEVWMRECCAINQRLSIKLLKDAEKFHRLFTRIHPALATLELIFVVREKWKRKSFLFSSCANKSERRLKWVHEKESKQMHQICVNGIKNWYSIVGRWKRRRSAWKLKISFEDFFFSCLHALNEQCKCTLKSPAPGDIRENPFAARVASFLLASRDTS